MPTVPFAKALGIFFMFETFSHDRNYYAKNQGKHSFS